MGQTRGIYVSIVLIMLMTPLVSSSISDDSRQRGGLDFNGDWVASVEPEIHFEWWLDSVSYTHLTLPTKRIV